MKKIILLSAYLSTFILASAQTDTLVFINEDFIVGEIKSMERNVLKIETDYSDDDFTIEWDGIKEIHTKTKFLITLTDGRRYNGILRSDGDGEVTILTDSGGIVIVDQEEIVAFTDIDEGFWNRIYASIDFGLDITRANNLRQFSMRSNLGYIARRWQLDGSYNNLFTRQDEIEDTRRSDGSVTFKYFLPRDWYPLASAEFLSNTEQQIRLRTTVKTGFGKYLVHTNQSYWGFSIGANYNNEDFEPDTLADRSSWEGFMGTELNLFNTGDLSLLTSIVAYPGITEQGRWRSDFKFDMKYDLPLDFYIRLGVTINYDNQPAEGSPNTDYVFKSGFGWEW